MRTNRLLVVPLLLLAIALVVIGTLQYRWLRRVSEAERQRMHGNLEFACERLAGEISTLFDGVFHSFLAPEDDDAVLRAHHELAETVYVADRDGDDWSVRRIDPRTGELAEAPVPEPLQRHLPNLGERGGRERWPRPVLASIPALFIVQLPAQKPQALMGRPRRVVYVELDRRALTAAIRERVHSIFEPGSDVELVAGDAVLYRSSADAGSRRPDVTHEFLPLAPRNPPRAGGPRERQPPPREEVWQIRVRHRAGGLDAIVAAAHRRNLAAASLVLLVLVASSALLIALLRRGERLRAQQQQFIASMSHELNTPLAVLRVASENLNDGIVQDPEKVSRYVRTIARETAHLSEMVNHVLELAGMNTGVAVAAREPVDVGAVIQDAVAQSRFMVDTSSIEIEVDVADDLPPVGGNRQALTRAVQNLVTNALRHAGAGKWVGVRATRDQRSVRVVVEDRGAGIAAEDAAHVFDAFYRGRGSNSVRGTGLGLTIVQQIIQEHGGSVAVERGRGGGAAFVIELPAEGAS